MKWRNIIIIHSALSANQSIRLIESFLKTACIKRLGKYLEGLFKSNILRELGKTILLLESISGLLTVNYLKVKTYWNGSKTTNITKIHL